MAHASTHPAHPLPPVAPRRLLLAQRLLRGEGSVEVTAFRAGETLTTAVHGVSADGRLVVAHVPNLLGSLGAFHTPAPLDVRVDVLRDALDLTLPTRLASVHLLGTLRWCRDSAEVAELGLRGRVADLVADVGPRVRVGVVETQRILLHDVDGVAVFCRHTLPLTSRGLVDRAELADLADDVLGTAPEVLADLADAVALGLLPGALVYATTGAGIEDVVAAHEAAKAACLAAGTTGCDGTNPRPGILILPAASTTECRVWVQFPQPRRVDQEEMIAADLFAQAFGLAVDRVIAAQRADDGKADLQRAVESHERIGQAVGILVERYRISPAAAFDRLREASQNRNLKLREIAARVTRTGVDPEQA